MKKRVLIVDDIPFVRKTINKILSSAQYQVVGEAENGMQALEMFKKLRPDVVTMDVVMPKMSGVEAAKKMVEMDKNVIVIMISAMGQENLVMDAINAGAKDYILKPFNSEEIIKTLDRLSA